jgi:hypothetical protein
VAAASATTKSDYIRDGAGVLLVEQILDVPGKMGQAGCVVVRVEIVESKSKGDLDANGKEVVPNPPGSQAGWVQSLKYPSAVNNLKTFVLALLGFSEAEVAASPPGTFQTAFGELMDTAQPARGMLINYSTYRQATRSGANAGKVNTYCTFSHNPNNTKDSIAARRAELDNKRPIRA